MRQVVEWIIENFQSHLKTVVKPAPAGQVTTIIGPSRNGKSAIIRSLRKLHYNSPNGQGFIRVGATYCRVTEIYDDGYRVIYYCTRGGISRYTIIDPAGNKQEYNDGKSVPLEVQEITGIRPVTVGDMTINLNLAEQLDGPFLGTKTTSAPARAKIIGKLAGTEELDYAGKHLATDIYRRKQDEKRLEERIGALQEQLQQYDYLEHLETQIAAMDELRERINVLVSVRNKLQELSTQRQVLQIKIRAEDEAYIATRFVEPAAEILARLERDALVMGNLKRLYEQRVIVIDGIAQADQVLTETANMGEAETMQTVITELSVKQAKLIKLSGERLQAQKGIRLAKEIMEETKDIVGAETGLNRLQEMQAQKEKLTLLWGQRTTFKNVLIDVAKTLQETEHIPAAEQAANQLSVLLEKRAKLTGLTAQRQELVLSLNQTQEVLTDTKGLQPAEDTLVSLQKSLESYKRLTVLNITWTDITGKIRESQEQVESLTTTIDKAFRDYVICLQEVGRCPTCGGEIELKKIKEVLQ